MSIVFTESFDHYGTEVARLSAGKWTDGAPNGSIIADGRCGTNCYQNNSSGNIGPQVGLVIGDQFSWGQVAVKRASMQAGSTDIQFQSAVGTPQFFFRFMADGSVEAWRGPNVTLGTLLGQSAPAVYSLNQYFVFEWEVTISATVGTFQAWIDGAEVIALAVGQDTQTNPAFATKAPYSAILFSMINSYCIDDVIAGDGINSGIAGKPNNGRIGPAHVTAALAELDSVVGGGFHKDFTVLSAADHGAMVDDNPPDDDTTYNSSLNPGNRDSYTFPDIKIGTGDVYAVNVLPMVKKSDTFNTRLIKPLVRSGGTTAVGTSQAVPDTQYEYRWQIYDGNPVGSVAWTVASVNAAEFGLEDFA